jgi:hypothetical protein
LLAGDTIEEQDCARFGMEHSFEELRHGWMILHQVAKGLFSLCGVGNELSLDSPEKEKRFVAVHLGLARIIENKSYVGRFLLVD